MSRPIALGSSDLRSALARTSKLARRVTTREVWFEFGWRWLTTLAALLVLDLLFALPVALRWVGLLGLIAYPLVVAWQVRKRNAKSPYPEEHSARLVEEGHPEFESALINAVQFQRMVGAAPQSQAELMRQEISRAHLAVAATPLENVINRDGERRALRVLFVALGAWIAAAVLLPSVVFTILPRLFLPWMDDIFPPFSLTKIDITPKGASVRFGGSLIVNVAVKGPMPDNLVLATESGKGPWTDAPLESIEPGKYAVTLNGLRSDTWIMAKGGNARSGRYLVKIVLPPVAQSLKATYTYPAYTKRKPAVETVGEHGIHGLRGTKVSLKISANRAVTGGELVIESPDAPIQQVPLAVDPSDPTSAIGAFPITASGTFRVALASSDAQVNSDAARGKIVLEKDQSPSVWFDEPPQEITVTPDMKVALAVGAEDDIGVVKVDLHRVINGIADNRKSLYDGAPLQHTGAKLQMDMADLGVRPGDEITYYADAFDNDPGHPNYAETDPYKIKVVSSEEFKKMLKDQRDEEKLSQEVNDIKDALNSLADRQQALADKMAKLAKELEKHPGDPALTKQMAQAQEEQKQLQKEAQQLSKQLEDYAKSPSASEIESALKEKVAEAAKSLSEAAKGMSSPPGASPSQAAEAAKKAAEAMNKTAGKAAATVGKALESLEKVAPLFNDVSRFMNLLDRQGQLVLQARQYEQKASMDEAARSKLAAVGAEQQRIKEELQTLQQDFRKDAANAQKDFPKAAASAVKIADEIGRRQIADTMGSAQDAFSQERGPDGFSNAKKAFDQMNAMVQQGAACQGECQGGIDIALSKSLGKPGLGKGLGSCLNPGMGTGQGSGGGSGMGGVQSGGSGSPASGGNHSSVAYTMNMRSLAGGGGRDAKEAHQRMPGQPADLSPSNVEVLPGAERQPPKAVDAATKGYPPEYRKLIRDYFISVTKEPKQ